MTITTAAPEGSADQSFSADGFDSHLTDPGFEHAAAGRWLMPLSTMVCTFDVALLRLTGLPIERRQAPLADYLVHVHPDDRPPLKILAQQVAEDHRSFDVTFRLIRPVDQRLIWVNSRGYVGMSSDGDFCVFGTNYDVTGFKLRERQSQLVAGEMSHRVKNLLTVVQSLFRMSAVRAGTMDELKNSFAGRLNALKALNDVMISPDRSLTTDLLVSGVMGPVIADDRMRINAAPITLAEEAAQTICLCLNELMTNAIKYGALSVPSGRVQLDVTHDPEDDSFVLSWHESGIKVEPVPPTAGGFGFTMLQDMTRMTMDGQPETRWRSDGLHFRCRWPASLFCAGS